MLKPYFDDGEGRVIYNGDCREILPELPQTAAICSDPPYGISYQNNGGGGVWVKSGVLKQGRTFIGVKIHDDDKPFDPSHLLKFPKVILWGSCFTGDCTREDSECLTSPPQASGLLPAPAARPAARMHFAALMSRSCRVPQDGHCHVRVLRESSASK